jgi:GNAT superfamily N-acetyltransferase
VTDYHGPVPLDTGHVLEGFDCGDETLNAWLLKRARSNQTTGNSRTWVVVDDDGRVLAFYASSTAVVMHAEATGKVRRNPPDPVPALLLGRLAVDAKAQGRGLAAAMIKHFLLKSLEVAELVGVRVLLVHAATESLVGLYRHFDFEPSPVDDLTLMLLVQDIGT